MISQVQHDGVKYRALVSRCDDDAALVKVQVRSDGRWTTRTSGTFGRGGLSLGDVLDRDLHAELAKKIGKMLSGRRVRRGEPAVRRVPSAEAAALLARIAKLDAQIERLREARSKQYALLGARAVEKLTASIENPFVGYHECPAAENPLPKCVYDDDEDTCHDYCLFCGKPEERK